MQDISEWHNLASAFARAANGCSQNSAVEHFGNNLQVNLAKMSQQIVQENIAVGDMTCFCIRDPKPRIIHAPCFRERVLHHALIHHVGPVLDKTLVDDTFACRKGKGALAAVQRCQHHLRRFPWFVQIDIRSFFANIKHEILFQLLQRKFKNKGLFRLFKKVVNAYHTSSERGLPIGSLISQHFANYYLAGLDRWLLEKFKVRGVVRYMDDVLWCCNTKEEARLSLKEAELFIRNTLGLEIKQAPRIGRCCNGTVFCGYRILPDRLLLSRRRKRGYITGRRYWEQCFVNGKIDSCTLQAGYAAVLGVTAHADATEWRREQLYRSPLANSLKEI